MSDLLRRSVGSENSEPPPPPRPRPSPISSIQESDDNSYSSDSSASSAASANTVRPSSREQQADEHHWTNYFSQELYLETSSESQKARYHVYLTPPSNPSKSPLFICHHGAGASGLSFALFANEIRQRLPEAGVLSLEARGHGSVVTDPTTNEEIADYSIATLTADAIAMIQMTSKTLNWPSLPPTVLVGHSLGGAIVTNLATNNHQALQPNFIGYAVLDVVEGSALEALAHMKTYLASRPSSFPSKEAAVTWHLRSRTLRSHESAAVSVPPLLSPSSTSDAHVWKTDLQSTAPWWQDWFTGMSSRFLQGRGAKLLILAGTDRLDKELMVGQMQGKFQLVVVPEAGHFVQEDAAAKVADVVGEFFKRNDRAALVLPMKVDEMIRLGKKV